MYDIAAQLSDWYAAGTPFALATVTAVTGSAPREPGATAAVRADGRVLGSLSGGCVESTVHQLALDCLATGRPARQRFGPSGTDAFAAGLSCGGDIEVLVQPVHPGDGEPIGAALAAVAAGQPVAVARVVAGPDHLLGHPLVVWPDRTAGGTGSDALDRAVLPEARALLAAGHSGTIRLGPAGECDRHDVTVFIHASADPPRMLVFGAVDFAAAVSRIGRFLGYRVTVCDARATFTTPERFPDADEVVVDWPHRYLARTRTDERTVICVLTHDARFDVPLLVDALRRPLAYVGALGSRRTHAQRLDRLTQAGLGPAELARLRSPIGLDLGARTPAETAVSIAAEIIAVRHGGLGLPLSTVSGPIHRDPARAGSGHVSVA